MDILAGILFYLCFVTPFITIPIVWNVTETNKVIRVLVGLFWAIILSCFLYLMSWIIVLRDGMGN